MVKDPFRIRDHVSDFDEVVADIVGRSANARATIPHLLDQRYGDGPSELIDIFRPAERRTGMPVHIFIHGGYWRMFSKRDYSYVASTITAAGAIAVIVDYALMPTVRMGVLVDQVRRMRRWVLDHIGAFGGDADAVTISGHSAGAHLATFLFNEPELRTSIKGALLLGGLYDLAPLKHSFLQAEISLTDDEIDVFTPMTHRYDPATKVTVLVGSDETAPFHDQAKAFSTRLADQGLQVEHHELAGANHMTSVRDLGIIGTEAAEHLARLIERN